MAPGEGMRKYRFISHYACFLSFSIMFVACESDEKKLQRLQGEWGTACLNAQMDQRDYEAARYPGGVTVRNLAGLPSRKADSLFLVWQDHKTKCDLATRDLNRFMHE